MVGVPSVIVWVFRGDRSRACPRATANPAERLGGMSGHAADTTPVARARLCHSQKFRRELTHEFGASIL